MFNSRVWLKLIISISLFFSYSTGLMASPWQCLQDWTKNNEAYLKQQQVIFYDADRFLTRFYAFDSTQENPIGNGDVVSPKLTKLGDVLEQAANRCGCTYDYLGNGPGAITHQEGLCGYW